MPQSEGCNDRDSVWSLILSGDHPASYLVYVSNFF